MANEALYMETTKISVSKTCAEIEEILIKHDVRKIWKEYDSSGQVKSICFVRETDGQPVQYKLPFRWEKIQEMAKSGKTKYKQTADTDQARRIAARLLLRWVEVQFAMIEISGHDFEEMFMPHILGGDSKTFYESLAEKGGILALKPGGSHVS